MKVFMSWSGDRSHAVAQLLGDWLQDVIQAVKPWISSSGIDRGEQWFRKIGDNLAEVSVGIVCLTPENKESPWIMFEAGALLKGSPDARVMTFLIDLKHQDVRQPLSQFNHTNPTRVDMLALVATLNGMLKDAALPEGRLTGIFETYWPKFEERYNAILQSSKPVPLVEERPQGEILTEVLETVRGLKQQLNGMGDSSLSHIRWDSNVNGMSHIEHMIPARFRPSRPPTAIGKQVALDMLDTGRSIVEIRSTLESMGYPPKFVRELIAGLDSIDRSGVLKDTPPDVNLD